MFERIGELEMGPWSWTVVAICVALLVHVVVRVVLLRVEQVE